MKILAALTSAVLALSLGALSPGALAEQHPALDAAGTSALAAHRGAIAAAAPIYGYNLNAGSWTIGQIPCAAMPQTILLRYTRQFPGGAESVFTALVPRSRTLVPRSRGNVQIVPVLYAGRTPFVPAPRNPRNVALFNRLVPASAARRDLTSPAKWQSLGACYAYMTGANAIALPNRPVGIAGSPTPFLHTSVHGRTAMLTLADRDSQGAYRLWTLRFNRGGRMTAASTRHYAVLTTRAQAAVRPTATTPAVRPEMQMSTPTTTAQIKTTQTTEPASQPAASQQVPQRAREQGWKFLPQPPQPPAKFIPNGPQPPAKLIPTPPGK